jgi:beta-aspartyl-dipeptidase (metallo-type)
MLTLLKSGEVYSPGKVGHADVLIAGTKIIAVGPGIELSIAGAEIEVVDTGGMSVVPGFIDQHVHILGGGGEGGPTSMIPEFCIDDAVLSGVTTLIGCLGTDGISRHVDSLLVKAQALETQGLSTYIFTGAYQVPVPTITGSLKADIMFIDKVIGVGEVAISDHRSSQPTQQELVRMAAEARVAGLLSGKAGKLMIHVGDGKQGLAMVMNIIDTTELPATQFVPTHVNRSQSLLEHASAFAQKGGIVDVTATIHAPDYDLRARQPGERISAGDAILHLLSSKVPGTNITMSSDGNGSLPVFDDGGEIVDFRVGSVRALLDSLRHMVLELGIPMECALMTVTSNVARCYKLRGKGAIAVGMDADITILDEDLNVSFVISQGRFLVRNGKTRLPLV